jgi:Rps23 Pro-64 3,4-dihydroxylase Tpa1-like proline 4-hydroxylase
LKVEDLGNKIFMYKNAIENDLQILTELNSIFSDYNQDYKSATINNHDYDPSLRSCTVFSLYTNLQDKSDYNNAKRVLNKKIDLALSKCILHFVRSTGIKIKEREPWEILKYEQSQKLTWHSDDGKSHPSTISFVYYINDDYEGGEIQFKDKAYSIPIKPQKNSLIIFPSSSDYIHRVLPVVSGVKHSVISFGK